MLPSFLLAMREGLEAALIIGIVLGVLQKLGRERLAGSVWQGAATAVGVSLAAALVLSWLGAEFEGQAEQIFEGVAMLSAAGLLTWMIFWMQSHAENLRHELEGEVRQAMGGRGVERGLFWLAFLAVGREGLELALFLVAAQAAAGALQTVLGAALGLAAAAAVGWALFAGSYRLSLRRFFQATNLLLVLFAAGLTAHGVHEFTEAGLIPALIDPVWNLKAVLPETSYLGQMATALFGYNADPALSEVLAYGVYFVVLGAAKVKAQSSNPKSQTPNSKSQTESQSAT